MQNQVKYMANNDEQRLSQLGASEIQISDFKKWPLPLHHEMFRIVAILFCSISLMTIGFRMAAKNADIAVQTFTYSDREDCIIPPTNFSTSCTIDLVVEQKLEPPIHVYYHITNFWQNHFLFVQSMSENQYYGTDLLDTDSCDGHKFGGKLDKGLNGEILVPCGLQGWSYFNDEITLNVNTADGSSICSDCLNYEDIALDVDKNRFTKVDLSNTIQNRNLTSVVPSMVAHDGTHVRGVIDIPDLDDESLMVWLRYGATSDIRKIHSRIPNITLNKGDILQFHINNQFNTHALGGTKSIILSEAKTFGGKHPFLATIFILSGVLPFVCMVGILSLHTYLSKWPREAIW